MTFRSILLPNIEKAPYILALFAIALLGNYNFEDQLKLSSILTSFISVYLIILVWAKWYPPKKEYSFKDFLLRTPMTFLVPLSVSSMMLSLVLCKKMGYMHNDITMYTIIFYILFCFSFFFILDKSRYSSFS